MSEQEIKQSILLDLGREPDLTIWVNNTGQLFDRRGVPVKFGCKGSADILGIVEVQVYVCKATGDHSAPMRLGRLFGLEVKTAVGRQRDDQKKFEAMVRRHGGFYRVVRSVPEARAAYEAARQGEP